MTKKAHKLSVGREFDFRLIGISSHENDYRVCWIINQHLNMQLARTENLVISTGGPGESQEFSLYQFYDDDTLLEFHLISNRCDNGFLIEEMRNIDFLLKITGECDDQYTQTLVRKLRDLENIRTAFPVAVSGLKSKDKLLF